MGIYQDLSGLIIIYHWSILLNSTSFSDVLNILNWFIHITILIILVAIFGASRNGWRIVHHCLRIQKTYCPRFECEVTLLGDPQESQDQRLIGRLEFTMNHLKYPAEFLLFPGSSMNFGVFGGDIAGIPTCYGLCSARSRPKKLCHGLGRKLHLSKSPAARDGDVSKFAYCWYSLPCQQVL